MISPSSFITPTLALAERKDCPRGYDFYNCYSSYDCCDVDPCDYEYGHASDPCYVAGGHPLQETTTTTITTTKHTQATTLADSTTEDPETDTETETSTTDDPETSSSSSSTETDAPTTTTADGTTLSTSIISTSDALNSATRTLPAPLPTTSSPSEDNSLPNGTIAGISVVSAVGTILILTSFFWFARRRRMSKRMSSMRGTSPTPMDSPSLGFDFGFGTTGGGSSPAIAYGSNSIRHPRAMQRTTHALNRHPHVAGTITLDTFDEIGRKTPLLVDLKPSGSNYMTDFHNSGGMAALLRELRPLLHLQAKTVLGNTLGELLDAEPVIPIPRELSCIAPFSEPLYPTSSLVVLHGNLAPNPSSRTPDQQSYFAGSADLARRIDDEDLDVTPRQRPRAAEHRPRG
ncbi:hypothetical protein NPX13_g6725 [Xylaria arbuscula]|uniref:Dihydroxy-acid/6-phosphogluconate dehydratase N-terminal domain-containing protein n=1 Tax=Xylaria arbuscula TaxID=114810 RepID=A0A9W8NBT9_9PEZI|nr:hypothetical protein NPX13_g6725 [Xylaria arbuscula]